MAEVDWEGFEAYLHGKYVRRWARQVFRDVRRYHSLMENLSLLSTLGSESKQARVLKALIAFSKYQGFYREFKERIKAHGIKWRKPSSLMAFLRILNNNSTDVLVWLKKASSLLDLNSTTFLEFLLRTGIRVGEGIKSFNLVIQLHSEGRLSEYFNKDLSTLEHFKFPKLFLRNTKNVYVSIVDLELLEKVTASSPITYASIKMKLQRRKMPLRMKGLRDFFATYMIRHGLIREEVDLLQGRISNDVFVRHYWSPSFKEFKERTFKALNQLRTQP